MDEQRTGDEAELNIQAKKVTDTQHCITVRLGADVLLVDKLDVTKHKSRADFIGKLCEGRPGINRLEVEQLLLGLAAQQGEPDDDKPQSSGPTRADLLDEMTPLARQQARDMLNDPQLVRRIVDDIASIGVAGEKELSLTIYVIGTSRLLTKPLAGIVQGPSSSGKSYTIERTATLFPPEALLLATQMTPQALFYLPPGSLAHRFVVAGERSRAEDDETAEATRALREMLSSGRLSKLVPVKAEGAMKTVVIEQEGPISYVESTTLSNIFDEDLNRCILLTTDERQQQTRRVINSIAAKFASNGAVNTKQIVERHFAIQRMIEPLTVLVPFAPRLAEQFADERVEARRAFPHVLSLIAASALLHQFQRQRDEDGHILAAQNDYHLARHLISGPLARQLGGGLSEPAKRFFERVAPRFNSEPFSAREAWRHVKTGRTAVYGWLSELGEAGVAQCIEPSKGQKPALWKFVGDISDAEVAILPPTEELFPS